MCKTSTGVPRRLPLDIAIRADDSGKPTVWRPDGKIASIYREIARKVPRGIARQAEDAPRSSEDVVQKPDRNPAPPP